MATRNMSIIGGLVLVLSMPAAAEQQTDSEIPEENYDFLSMTSGSCVPKIGVGIEPKFEASCKRMTEARRYRGTWRAGFETSLFTPFGKQDCIETRALDCAELSGVSLPWPPHWECPRTQMFELEFIGRRNVLPGFDPSYTIVVDKLISAKRLPDPYDEDCDPKLHPELKAKE